MRFLLFVIISFSLISQSGCSKPIPLRPEELPKSQSEFVIPKIDHWTESNGLEVYLLEDHELPLISGDFYFRFGSLTESIENSGETSALMSQIRAGGFKGSSPQQLDADLDALGASIEGSAGSEFSSISFFSHKEDIEFIFDKLRGIITEPTFDVDRLRLWKSQALDAIDRRREDPEVIASATFALALYGPDSVYSSLSTKESITQITDFKLKELSRIKILPKGTILAVTGDISSVELKALLSSKLNSWQGATMQVDIPDPKDSGYKVSPGLYFVNSDFEQSSVIIGQLGPARMSNDQFALSVFNRYFGRGGFNSVLFAEVRSKRGYAYTVDGGFAPGAKSGEFSIDMGTRSEVTEEAIKEVFRQLHLVRSNSPPSGQIEDVKSAVEQGFIFNFAKPSSALSREVLLKLLGYPGDFNQTYLANISAISPDDVRQCALSRTDPDALVVVVVGKLNGKSLAKKLNLQFYPVMFNTYPKVLK